MITAKRLYSNNSPNTWVQGSSKLDRLELILAATVAFLAPINAARLPGIYFTYADMAAIICVVIMLANRGLPNRLFGALTGVYFLGLFLFCSALMMGSIINGNLMNGLIGLMQYSVAFLVFPVVLLRRTRREAWVITFAFLASILVICLHGITIITFDMDLGVRYISYSRRLRGLVGRENELGALLAMTVPLVVLLVRTKWFPSYIAWLGLACMLYAVMLTGSNTGIFCFTFAFLATMLTGKNLLRDSLLLLSFIAALLLVVGFLGTEILPDIFEKRVVSAFSEGNLDKLGSITGRMELNSEALHLAADNLFIGAGFDQYREISPHGAPVHNLYLLVLVEGGIFALLGFLIMLAALFAQASQAVVYTQTLRSGIYLVITLMVFAIVISALPHIYARFLALPWIITLGMTMTLYSTSKPKVFYNKYRINNKLRT